MQVWQGFDLDTSKAVQSERLDIYSTNGLINSKCFTHVIYFYVPSFDSICLFLSLENTLLYN